jgi:mRNA-degrading endonuclease RelE of RelBE toxin-antitoxin system
LNFSVLFRRSAADFLNSLPEKSQKIIKAKLKILESDPRPGKGDKEKLNVEGMEVFRLHIGRSFTTFYLIHIEDDKQWVEITHLMTIEQAHKRYGRL